MAILAPKDTRFASALPARGASIPAYLSGRVPEPLPRRCLHGVHHQHHRGGRRERHLCLGAACTGCIPRKSSLSASRWSLPRRCLHGVHLFTASIVISLSGFASALPARGASALRAGRGLHAGLCLGAACTGCIAHAAAQRLNQAALCLGAACTGCIAYINIHGRRIAPLPRRCLHGVHHVALHVLVNNTALPRRCLHGVHRQKPTNCGTPFCSIRRESVDSFSEINNKDSCADYFPALFCCQGDLHHHYRQPRTDNRPVLRCEQHRLFLFILSSHYRRLL